MTEIDDRRSAQDRAQTQTLGFGSFALLGAWAVFVTLYSLDDLVFGLRVVSLDHAYSSGSVSRPEFGLVVFIGLASGVCAVIGSGLGLLQVGTSGRGPAAVLRFAVTVPTGIVLTVCYHYLRNTAGDGFTTSVWSWRVLGTLGDPVIAALVLYAAWLQLRPITRRGLGSETS